MQSVLTTHLQIVLLFVSYCFNEFNEVKRGFDMIIKKKNPHTYMSQSYFIIKFYYLRILLFCLLVRF
jgi:hypothetical protein